MSRSSTPGRQLLDTNANRCRIPGSAIVAMKQSLQQSTIVGVQRLIGALIGAVRPRWCC